MKKFRSFEYRLANRVEGTAILVFLDNIKVASILDFEVIEEEDLTAEDVLDTVSIKIDNKYNSFNLRLLTDLADLVKMLVYGEE